ncbi:MAG: hypothetical protein GDA54_03430 [Alphaproteobacteria bacterium GM7ARS4]|nr:hypothetical protein [Alphaproteobacteria bacterium GM7ARS4]
MSRHTQDKDILWLEAFFDRYGTQQQRWPLGPAQKAYRIIRSQRHDIDRMIQEHTTIDTLCQAIAQHDHETTHPYPSDWLATQRHQTPQDISHARPTSHRHRTPAHTLPLAAALLVGIVIGMADGVTGPTSSVAEALLFEDEQLTENIFPINLALEE